MLLIWHLKACERLAQVRTGDILLIHTERGPTWSQPRVNQCMTIIPNMKLVIVHKSDSGVRLSWVTPGEAFQLQGMSLPPSCSPDAGFEYRQLIKIAGNAFHLQSVIGHTIATMAIRGHPGTWQQPLAGPSGR